MSRILCKVGGGGGKAPKGDAVPANVLAGKTFSNKGNVGLTGTMINRGAVTATIGAGETYAIGDGYHNGNGIITAKDLASQTNGTATAPDILTGKTAWVNGVKVTGSIISQAGGTYNPTTSVKTLVSGGRYVSSDVKVNAFALPPASALKKGYKYTLYGQSVTGTFEGYTTSPLYIVQNGVVKNLKINSFTNLHKDDEVSDMLGVENKLTTGYGGKAYSDSTIDLSAYKYLRLIATHMYRHPHDRSYYSSITWTIGVGITQTTFTKQISQSAAATPTTITLDISNLTGSYYILIEGALSGSAWMWCMFKSIYLSAT